ncbi:hypothetical protein D3C84_820240 [compost metagenome]
MLDLQGVHEIDDVAGQRGRLAIAQGLVGEEVRIAVAARIGHQHAITLGRQQGRDFVIAVNVVRPAVQQNHHRAIGRARFGVRHAEQAGVDMLERAERRGRRLRGAGRGGGRGCLRVSYTQNAQQTQG